MQAKIDNTPIVPETPKTPEEVLRLESLLLDNWWKMIVDRIENEIRKWEDTVNKPRPLWLNQEQIIAYGNDMELIKLKTAAYKEVLDLPKQMIQEYTNTNFRASYTKQV